MDHVITLDVWSDVVCPWCYVGKRRLETALAQEAAEASATGVVLTPVVPRFRAFELRPEMPPDGADARAFYARLFGGEERYDAIAARMRSVGEEVGIAFDYPRIRRAANTRLAHRLIALAGGVGRASAAFEALHRAYFEEGRDVGAMDAIVEVAADPAVGLDPATTRDRLLAGEGTDRVEADERLARELGITGVPMFVAGLDAIDQGIQPVGVSGAQPVEVMHRLLALARDRAGARADASRVA